MISLVQNHLSDIEEICRCYDVVRLAVFGSAAREVDFDIESSDIDFLVSFRNAGQPGYARRFLGFAESLETALGRSVDVLTERSIAGSGWEGIIREDVEGVYDAAAQ